ncbi:MAG: HlyD family secretion protein, partial [Planctomycetota bacterium]
MTRVGQVLLCLLLAGGAYATIRWIQATEPTAQRGAAVKETAMLVEVVPAERGTYSPEIVALGTVEPEREVRLAPRVAGEVLERHPRLAPGSFVDAQDELLTIDPTDYATAKRARDADHLGAEAGREQARAELGRARAALDEMRAEVDQARAEVEQAEADLEVEQGRRVVAERDFELLEERFDETQRRLALREPQLAAARARIAVARARVAAGEARLVAAQAEITAADAALAAAEARVLATEAAADQAQADFDRTTIVAPFDAHVLSRSADKGSQVSPGDEIAHLVGTAEYQVIATVPLDKLRWIRFPSSPQTKGSRVTIHHEAAWGEGRHREGHVARL